MITIKDASKTYRPKKGPATTALNHINLVLPDKGMVFVLGKSGSGKTTLLNCLGGLDSLDEGEIIVNGASLSSQGKTAMANYRNRFVGFVFQNYVLFEGMSVYHNVSLALLLQGKEDTSKVMAALKTVELSDLAQKKVNELSGGQKQRVAIARAIVKNPNLILADEPTGALDSETGASIFSLLKELSKQTLVIVVTHDQEAANQYGDRLIQIKDGQIISDKEKEQLIRNKEEAPSAPISQKGWFPLRAMLLLFNHFTAKRKGRLIASIILGSLAFSFFGFAYLSANSSKKSIAVSSLPLSDATSVTISEIGPNGNYDTMKKAGANVLKLLSQETGLNFLGVLPCSVPFNNYEAEKADGFYSNYYSYAGSGALPIDSNNNFLKIVAGKIPEKKNEVAISDYQYGRYQRYGFKRDDGEIIPSNEMQTEQDFLDKKPAFSLYDISSSTTFTATIVGILDTKTDPSYYEDKNLDYSTALGNMYSEIAEDEYFYGLPNLLFISDEYGNILKEDTGRVAVRENGSRIYVFDSSKDESTPILPDYIYNASTLSNICPFDDTLSNDSLVVNYYNLGKHFSNNFSMPMSQTELLDYSRCKSFGQSFDALPSLAANQQLQLLFSASEEEINPFIYWACGIYVQENGLPEGDKNTALRKLAQEEYDDYVKREDIPSQINFLKTDSETTSQLKSFYVQYLSKDAGYYQNDFGNDTGLDIASQSLPKLVKRVGKALPLSSLTETLVTREPPDYTTKKSSIKIGGVYFKSRPSWEHEGNNITILSQDLYLKYRETIGDQTYSYFITETPTNSASLSKLADLNEKTIGSYRFQLRNRTMAAMNFTMPVAAGLAPFIAAIGGFFALFSCLLLAFFLSSSIKDHTREIGLIKALGGKDSFVFSLFALSSFLVGLFCLIFALILDVVFAAVANHLIISYFEVFIRFFNLSSLTVAILLGVSMGSSIIGGFIPCLQATRKNPISCLKED